MGRTQLSRWPGNIQVLTWLEDVQKALVAGRIVYALHEANYAERIHNAREKSDDRKEPAASRCGFNPCGKAGFLRALATSLVWIRSPFK
jgi:hypothetical protein